MLLATLIDIKKARGYRGFTKLGQIQTMWKFYFIRWNCLIIYKKSGNMYQNRGKIGKTINKIGKKWNFHIASIEAASAPRAGELDCCAGTEIFVPV